jgi:hypothetical protein
MSRTGLIIKETDYKLVKAGAELPPIIIAKTCAFWSKGLPSHNIDPRQFDTIYSTSDIHADVYKLNRLLSSAGLIDSTGYEDMTNILKKPFKWLKPKTLFIIVGDVVDGARNGFSEILDDIGDIELILHIYIFNLRLMALEVGSDIRFTIGNHDYHSVIKENSDDLPEFYNMWVHKSAQRFFGSRKMRRSCLLPFYLCSPYFIITADKELAFIHAGINSEDGQDIMDLSDAIVLLQNKLDATGNQDIIDLSGALVLLQEKLDKEGDQDIKDVSGTLELLEKKLDAKGGLAKLSMPAHKFISEIGTDIKAGGPLWTRFYSYGSSKDVCDALEDPFKMVIVGHCQTDTCSKGPHMTEILQDPKFSECATGGCVLLGCNKKGPPALGFVDISLSSAFRNRIGKFGFPTYPLQIIKADEDRRRAEFLKLEHVQDLDSSDRYYNKISREKVGGTGGNESLLYWQAQPALKKLSPVLKANNKNGAKRTNGGSKKGKNKKKKTTKRNIA